MVLCSYTPILLFISISNVYITYDYSFLSSNKYEYLFSSWNEFYWVIYGETHEKPQCLYTYQIINLLI
jgi:hypothetical protein